MLRASGDILAGDDDGGSADAGHHDFEHVDGVGDHRRVEHVFDGDRRVVEDGGGVVVGGDALVDGDLGEGFGVVAVLGAVLHRDLGVAAVLGDVAVGDVELGLGRAVVGGGRAVAPTAGSAGRIGRSWGGPGGGGDHDDVAESELDGGSGSPDHRGAGGAAEVDDLGEVDLEAEVLGDRGGDEGVGLADVGGADAVDLGGVDAGVVEGFAGQLGPLFEGEDGRGGGSAFGFPLGNADDGCFASESHDLLRFSVREQCTAGPGSNAA